MVAPIDRHQPADWVGAHFFGSPTSAGDFLIDDAGNAEADGSMLIHGDHQINGNSAVGGALAVTGSAVVTGTVTAGGVLLGSVTDALPFPLSGYGLSIASIDPMLCQGSSGVGGNTIWVTRVFVPAGVTITNLYTGVRTGGTWDTTTTPNQIGIYTDAGVKIDTTADDGTLWAAAGWRGGALLAGTIPAQTSGRYVYTLAIVRGFTGVNFAFPSSAQDPAQFQSQGPGGGNRRAMYVTATSLPASFTPSSYGSSTGFLSLSAGN